MRAFYDHQANLIAIDLHQPGDAVDGVDIGRATVLVDGDGMPRSIEIVGVRDHGADDAVSAVVDRWPTLSRSGLLAAAHAALAAPDLEIDVSVRAAA